MNKAGSQGDKSMEIMHGNEQQNRRCRCCRLRTRWLLPLLLVPIVALGYVFWSISARCHCPRPCLDGWIGYRGKCYYFSEAERNWTASRDNCSDFGASLAVIDSLQDLVFLLRHKSHFDSWVGLHRQDNGAWKWAEGTEFNDLFPIKGDEKCVYLKDREVSTSRCYIERTWICTVP
uniref:C-type lectin domain family 2 member D-like n=1 Tax=Dromaius novaehollandiae TaxID=8790 RepID=A0A8C4P9I2_DRONO